MGASDLGAMSALPNNVHVIDIHAVYMDNSPLKMSAGCDRVDGESPLPMTMSM